MYREEAIQLMCDTIDDFNRQQGSMNGLPAEQVEEYIVQTRPQMEFVNSMLYDTLKANGVII